MNAENLALVFAPSLMKGKGRGMFPARSGLPGIERDHRLKVLIVLKLITHADCIGTLYAVYSWLFFCVLLVFGGCAVSKGVLRPTSRLMTLKQTSR